MKCNKCMNLKYETLGADECGAGNVIVLCRKGHWNGDPQVDRPEPGIDPWAGCADFKREERTER